MSSSVAACSHFQEHAFKKDLCVNCMKQRRLHNQTHPTKRGSISKTPEEKEDASKPDSKAENDAKETSKKNGLVAKGKTEKPSNKASKPNVASKPQGLKKGVSVEDTQMSSGQTKATKTAPKSSRPTVLGNKPQLSSKSASVDVACSRAAKAGATGRGKATQGQKAVGKQETNPAAAKPLKSPQRPQAPPPEAPVPVFRKSSSKAQSSDDSADTSGDTFVEEDNKGDNVDSNAQDSPTENSVGTEPQESHYYHKYDITMKGKQLCPPAKSKKAPEDPRKKMLLEKLHEKIESGDVSDLCTESIAMPYTVVEISKFPPNVDPTGEEIPPKLPDTPAPQTSGTCASSGLSYGTKVIRSASPSSRSGSTEKLDSSANFRVHADREKSHTPSPKARLKYRLGREDSPDTSNRAEPVLPLVLHEEAEKMKANMRSPATPRKVPIMIQPQEHQLIQDGAYEPIEIDDEAADDNTKAKDARTADGKFRRQSPARVSGARSDAFEAKKAALSNLSFGGGGATPSSVEGKQEEQEDTTVIPPAPPRKKSAETLDKMVSKTFEKSDAAPKQEKSKKGGKSFFKKLLKIGSSNNKDGGEKTNESEEELVADTTKDTCSEVSVTEKVTPSDSPGSASPDLKSCHRPQSCERQIALSVSDVQSALAKRKPTSTDNILHSVKAESREETSFETAKLGNMTQAISDKNLTRFKTDFSKTDVIKTGKAKEVNKKTFPKKDSHSAILPIDSKFIKNSAPNIPNLSTVNAFDREKRSNKLKLKDHLNKEKEKETVDKADVPKSKEEFQPENKDQITDTAQSKPVDSQKEIPTNVQQVDLQPTYTKEKDLNKELQIQVDSVPSTRPKRVSPKKKPGVPPPSVPPPEPPPPQVPPRDEFRRMKSRDSVHVEDTQEDKATPAPEVVSPPSSEETSVSPATGKAELSDATITPEDGQNEGTPAAQSPEAVEPPSLPLSRDNSFEGQLVRSPSSESQSLSTEGLGQEGDGIRTSKRRARPPRPEARQSKILRSKMGAPPPPPPGGAGDRRSVSESSEPGSQPTSPAPLSPLHTSFQASVPSPPLPMSPKTTSPKIMSPKPFGSSKVSPRTLEISGPIAVTPMCGGATITLGDRGPKSPLHIKSPSVDDATFPKRRLDSVKKHNRNRTVTEGIQLDLQAMNLHNTSPDKAEDDRVQELLEKRTSKFLNRALPPPPSGAEAQTPPEGVHVVLPDMENFYEFVPSESGKDSTIGTPQVDTRTCYEDIDDDDDDIYDDPAELTFPRRPGSSSTSSSSQHSHLSQASGGSQPLPRSQSNDYLEPVQVDQEENVYPDIIPTSALIQKKSSLERVRPVPAPRGGTPPRGRARTSESSRMSQHYIMPYINIETAMDKDRPALTIADGFRKMSVLNLQSLQTLGEATFAKYVCPNAEFHGDLSWSDFSLGANGVELSLGIVAFYKAHCSKITPNDCYLMVSGKSIKKDLLELCHANVISLTAMFRDRISADYFPEPSCKNRQVYQLFGIEQTNIAILNYAAVQGLVPFIHHTYKQCQGSADDEFERISCYVMAQILNGVLYLHERDQRVCLLHSNDIVVVTTEGGETYPVVNLATPAKHLVGQDNQLFDSIIVLIFLVLRIQWNKEHDPYTAIPEKTRYSRAFRRLVSLLYQKQFTLQSLIMARNILEYMLWGPEDEEVKVMEVASGQESAYSVWLEVSRCKLVNQFVVRKTELTLEQASRVRYLCSMTGNALLDTVKILNINF